MMDKKGKTKADICECHKWALNDTQVRSVRYCSVCKAWICDDCRPKLTLRAIAWLRRGKSKK